MDILSIWKKMPAFFKVLFVISSVAILGLLILIISSLIFAPESAGYIGVISGTIIEVIIGLWIVGFIIMYLINKRNMILAKSILFLWIIGGAIWLIMFHYDFINSGSIFDLWLFIIYVFIIFLIILPIIIWYKLFKKK